MTTNNFSHFLDAKPIGITWTISVCLMTETPPSCDSGSASDLRMWHPIWNRKSPFNYTRIPGTVVLTGLLRLLYRLLPGLHASQLTKLSNGSLWLHVHCCKYKRSQEPHAQLELLVFFCNSFVSYVLIQAPPLDPFCSCYLDMNGAPYFKVPNVEGITHLPLWGLKLRPIMTIG